ncbi:winged helix-turn-helix domain-containing protein [Psychromonas ossibalaenae]|uniref:winged helix-turn-helix domain-containing protein n=1 Tax=Psychromonas ossibalaenae TaxID=444922 RepID=UPI00036C9222|nr:winged helix-turn-helix domain-containing protein [Psychromonas ossibalaenae]
MTETSIERYILKADKEYQYYPVESKLYIVNTDKNQADNSVLVELKPIENKVLHLLVKHPGTAVNKELFLTTVWKGKVVTDGSLHQAIFRLRCILGDTQKPYHMVKTAPNLGYILNCEIHPDTAYKPACKINLSDNEKIPALSKAAPNIKEKIKHALSKYFYFANILLFLFCCLLTFFIWEKKNTDTYDAGNHNIFDSVSVHVWGLSEKEETRTRLYVRELVRENLSVYIRKVDSYIDFECVYKNNGNLSQYGVFKKISPDTLVVGLIIDEMENCI